LQINQDMIYLQKVTAYCEGKVIARKIDNSDTVIYNPLKRHDHTIDEYTTWAIILLIPISPN